jgi:hypothetical protein
MFRLIDGGLKPMNQPTTETNKLFIYFDYKVASGNLYLCAAAYKKEGSAVETAKKVVDSEDFAGWNNFHRSLKAMNVAIELLNEMGLAYHRHDVVVLNQNDRIFDWVLDEKYSDDYEDLMERIYASLRKTTCSSFALKKCDGKINRAKKMLSMVKVKAAERSMDMSKFTKSSDGKIVRFGS